MREYIIWESDGIEVQGHHVTQHEQREEIVRCRDCTGFYETWDGWECERFSGEYHRAEADGFCAWAERRGELDFEDIEGMTDKFCAWGECE